MSITPFHIYWQMHLKNKKTPLPKGTSVRSRFHPSSRDHGGSRLEGANGLPVAGYFRPYASYAEAQGLLLPERTAGFADKARRW